MKDRIRTILEREKLSNKEFASLTNMQVSNVSHLLSGRSNPNIDTTKRILEAFPNINSEWLLLGIGPMYKHEKFVQGDLFSNPIQETSNIATSQPQIPEEPAVIHQQRVETQPVTERVVVKEVVQNAAPKKIEKIVIYYSDNTYEFFNPQKV